MGQVNDALKVALDLPYDALRRDLESAGLVLEDSIDPGNRSIGVSAYIVRKWCVGRAPALGV
jgi:hypothetical protein